MNKLLDAITKMMVATIVGTFAVMAGVEVFASSEGAGPAATITHNVPVKFHAAWVYVTPFEASLYHVAFRIFIACWIIGMLCVVAKKASNRDYKSRQ